MSFIQTATAAIAASLLMLGLQPKPANAQVPPSAEEISRYGGLHKAAADGDEAEVRRLLAGSADPNARDGAGRTTASRLLAPTIMLRALGPAVAISTRSSAIAMMITIAAVKDDRRMVELAIRLGGNPKAITSRYDGTALIAAAHLGHEGVVEALIEAGAPLDHVNNLGWTALIEAVVLGDGGKRHVATARALVEAGARKDIGDRSGVTPLQHARQRQYQAMIEVLE